MSILCVDAAEQLILLRNYMYMPYNNLRLWNQALIKNLFIQKIIPEKL